MEITRSKVLHIPYEEIIEYFGIPKIINYGMIVAYPTYLDSNLRYQLPNKLYIERGGYVTFNKFKYQKLIESKIDISSVNGGTVEVRTLSKMFPSLAKFGIVVRYNHREEI